MACVVGRWKSKLTRAVGHAGAMSGGSDDAAGKERWFMDKFGVDGIFTPEKPVFSAKGAVVTNIAHIPLALSAVMRENATRPDFAPEGSLALKAWFGSESRDSSCLPGLIVPVVEATPPYNAQIAALNEQIGALLPRQSMKDTLRRVADGRQDAGDQPARRVDARCRAVSAGIEHLPRTAA